LANKPWEKEMDFIEQKNVLYTPLMN